MTFCSLFSFLSLDSYRVQYALSFLPVFCYNKELHRLYVVAKSSIYGAQVKISFPLLASANDTYFTLSGGEGQIFEIPETYIDVTYNSIPAFEEVSNATVVVAAIGNVDTYVFSGCVKGNQASAYRVLDVDSIGTDYWIPSYHTYPRHSVIAIVAIFDNTSVNVFFNTTSSPVLFPSNLTEKLNQFQTYFLALEFDATGVRVNSSKPVTVVSGKTKAVIPNGNPNTDPIAECVQPVSTWGRIYSLNQLIMPGLSEGYVARVLSSSNHNKIRWEIDGVGNETILHSGDFLQIFVDKNDSSPLDIVAEDKALVIQYTLKNDQTSPVMVQVPCLDCPSIKREIIFPVFDMTRKRNTTCYLNLRLPQGADISRVHLVGESKSWRFINQDSQGWCLFQTTLEAGTHRLTINGNFSVQAIVYAYENKRAYAYTISWDLLFLATDSLGAATVDRFCDFSESNWMKS